MSPKPIRVSISGAGGFLGQATVSALSQKTAISHIRALYSHRDKVPQTLPPGVEPLVGDLTKPSTARALVEYSHWVIHLANRGFPGDLVTDVGKLVKQNLGLTGGLLEAMANHSVRNLIYPSTGGALYRADSNQAQFTESSEMEFRSAYALGKIASEHMIQHFENRGLVKGILLRISTAYGAGQLGRSKQGVIGVAMDKLLRQQSMPVWTDLSTTKDYIHVDDITHAMECCLKTPSISSGVYNIGSGTGTSLAELFALIEKVSGESLKLDLLKAAPSEIPRTVLDSNKFTKATSWKPQVSLEEGCRSMWEEIQAKKEDQADAA